MMRTLYVRILSCLLLVVLPGALLAADQPTAMLYSHGTALLNGTNVPRSSAIFPGDLVQTNADSVANINATGSTVLVLNGSILQYEGSTVTLEHGGVRVSTSKSLTASAGGVTVSPAASVLTEFEVRDVDGKVQIVARKGGLSISDETGTTTLAQGQETTRDESQKKRKQTPGAAPAAGGGVLDSPVAIGIGAGAIIGVTAWVLSKSDDPESPSE